MTWIAFIFFTLRSYDIGAALGQNVTSFSPSVQKIRFEDSNAIDLRVERLFGLAQPLSSALCKQYSESFIDTVISFDSVRFYVALT